MALRLIRAVLATLLLGAAVAANAQIPGLNLQFEKLEEALHLTPAQKDQYDLAVGASKRMLLHVALVAMQAREKLAEELAKPRPDFGALDETRRALVEDGRALRREALDEWRKFFAMLDRDQVDILRRYIEEHADRVGLLGEFIQQLLPGPAR